MIFNFYLIPIPNLIPKNPVCNSYVKIILITNKMQLGIVQMTKKMLLAKDIVWQ